MALFSSQTPFILLTPLAFTFTIQVAQSAPAIVTSPPPGPGQIQIDADQVDGQLDVKLKAQGKVVVTRDSQQILSDWLDYYRPQNRIKAGDRFTLLRPNEQIDGNELDYYLDSNVGTATAPVFNSKQQGYHIRGQGKTAQFRGKDQYRIHKACATTCDIGDNAWYLSSSTLDLDYTRNVGIARNATLIFQGVPIAYTPWVDFPLNNQRKSGFLIPHLKGGSNGAEIALPYYWNIAPNYDATFTPYFNKKHGQALGTEFRYLQPHYSGTAYTKQHPHDAITDQKRYFWTLRHQHTLTRNWSFGYNATIVSDDAYFLDFGNRETIADNNNLLRTAWTQYNFSWEKGNAQARLNAQRYQTLQQNPASPLNSPYTKSPQITLTANQKLPLSFSVNVSSDFTRFTHFPPPFPYPVPPDEKKENPFSLQEGNRFVFYPSVTWDKEKSWGFLRPKLGVHYTHYALMPFKSKIAATQIRALPIFSVDSGLFFERGTKLLNHQYMQTLEPRIYYVNIPTRSQNELPNFDTSENSIGMTQLFTENRFSGSDRINGTNQVSLALSSRLINHNTGLEHLRVSVGQRFYLRDTTISLEGKPVKHGHNADLVASASGTLARNWLLNSNYLSGTNQDKNYQYGTYQNNLYQKLPAPDTTKRYSIGVQYHPQPGHLISMRYFYGNNEQITSTVKGESSQVDVGIQWPLLGQRVYAVARENYSLKDNKRLERLAGLEYNAGCWSLRVLGQKYLTDITMTKTAFFLQLELKGIGDIGNNPMDILRGSLPGYNRTTNTIQP